MANPKLQEKLVFAVTNLGTRIAMAVSQESTVGDFKRLIEQRVLYLVKLCRHESVKWNREVGGPCSWYAGTEKKVFDKNQFRRHFAGKFEMVHLNCFPQLGKISVCGLKVRKKSCFYYLSESFPLKHAFQDAKGWFLHIVVCHVQDQTAAKTNGKRFRRNKWKMKKFSCFKSAFLDIRRAVYFSKRKKKCNRLRKNTTAKCPINGFKQAHLLSQEMDLPVASRADSKWRKQGDLSPVIQCPSETMSGTISVSGIINRYFSGYDEVTSNSAFSCMDLEKNNKEHVNAQIASDCQEIEVGIPLSLVPKTPPQVHFLSVSEPNSRASRDTPREKVGTRLVEASVNLGLSTSKQNPALSLCRFIDRRSGLSESVNNPIRSLIFEITDEDD